MSENTSKTEGNSDFLDISSRITEIIEDTTNKDPKTFLINDYLRTLRSEPALSITMDWHGPNWAIWAKSFVEDSGALDRGQKRKATIRCSEAEKAQVPNAFASKVGWVDSNKPQ